MDCTVLDIVVCRYYMQTCLFATLLMEWVVEIHYAQNLRDVDLDLKTIYMSILTIGPFATDNIPLFRFLVPPDL